MSLKMVLSGFLNLLEKIEMRRKFNEDIFDLEFQKLKTLTENLKHNPDYSCKYGAQEINRCKNRYKDILPYDYTRVILTEDSDKPGSDYTNANYIKGASGSAAYIACQGPLPHTVVDFWRMIWECEVKVVIMACNEKESGKQKCGNYWPEDEAKDYGNFHVQLIKIRYICSDFLVRTLKVFHEEEERIVYQFHYITWPDHGVPTSVEPILHLIQLVRKFQSSDSVPVLVHCSAGCGRTGTICAIDYVWRLMISGRLKAPFNLYDIISRMRQQRIAMVQTKEQYILVHRAVAALFEQQLELIANHFYENIDKDGYPLIVQDLQKGENIYEEVNCENFPTDPTDLQIADEPVREQQHEIVVDEGQKESPASDESHVLRNEGIDKCNSTTASHQFTMVSTEKSCENSKKYNMDSHCRKISDLANDTTTAPSNHEQNVNFTLSLPLSAVKQKCKNVADADHHTNVMIENNVSCSVKIDSEGKIQVVQQKDDYLQLNSSSYSNCPTNSEKRDSKMENSFCLATTDCCSTNSLASCEVAQKSKIFPLDTEKSENDNGILIDKSVHSEVKEKHSDIEEIFQKILSNRQNQMDSESLTFEKQFNSVTSSDSLKEMPPIDKTSSINKASELDTIKDERIGNECDKMVSVKSKESKVDQNDVLEETQDILVPSLTNDSTEASRQRYISLVSECEQSFSEIERLLEEKDNTLTIENNCNKESCTTALPECGNFNSSYQAVHCNKVYNSDNSYLLQNKSCPFVSDNTTKKSAKTSENDSPFLQTLTLNHCEHKQLEKEDTNTMPTSNVQTLNNLITNKNNNVLSDTKQKWFGIEKALKINQADDDSLEYIDSAVTGQDTHFENDVEDKQIEMKQNIPETEISNFNLNSSENSENIKSISVHKNTMPSNVKIANCNVRTELSRKEGNAHKRTGKIFENEEIFHHINQRKSSNVSFGSNDEDNILNSSNKESSTHNEKVDSPVLNCIIDKENFQSNSQVPSTCNTYNNVNVSECFESENLNSCATTEVFGMKATVIRRPSIAKLKALFEKTVPIEAHSKKQHRGKHPLSRSQSHHIHRDKYTDKDSAREKYSAKPKLLGKVTKIFHSPSVENNYDQKYDDRISVQWKSSDIEAISFSTETKEIPKPLINDKENRLEEHDAIQNESKSDEKCLNCPLNIDNTMQKYESKENISEQPSVGCFDVQSLMSIVTKEQNVNKTQWYEHERNGQENESQILDKKNVSHHFLTEEKKKQYNSNDVTDEEVRTEHNTTQFNDFADVPLSCKLSEINRANNSLPPELPTKKKYQYASFCSYAKDKDNIISNEQNILFNSIAKTKWYYENDNKSIGSELQIVCLNDDNITCSDTDDNSAKNNISIISDQNEYQTVTNYTQGITSSQTPASFEVNKHSDFQPPLPPKKKTSDAEKAGNTNWYCNEMTSFNDSVTDEDAPNRLTEFHPYVNVLKTKDGIFMTNTDETNRMLHIATRAKPDLYTNVNTTSMKNIEQIENSLQQHPRGAIIDLTSRQSYANEQQSDIKSIKYGSDPKLSETVITTDLEESHYCNEKPIYHDKLWENKCETVGIVEKNKKHYETVWPQKVIGEQTVYNQDIQNAKYESVLHKSSLNLKTSDTNKCSTPSKPSSSGLNKILCKSKSSSALFLKTHDKNSVPDNGNKFKDMTVNKVVCELNSILNVLTTRPFKSAQKETFSSFEKPGDTETLSSRQSNVNHPSAPPRRKLKNDTFISDLELHGSYTSATKSTKLPEKSVITDEMQSNAHYLSKSATMSAINKSQFIDPRKRNASVNKDNCATPNISNMPQFVGNSNRIASVYENVNSPHPHTVSLENDIKNVSKKPPSKLNKLKHSRSDASVCSLLKTKYINKDKGQSNQEQQYIPHPVFKSETRSYIKRQTPVVNKHIIMPATDSMKVEQSSPIQSKQQLTCSKQIERRSMDDMDAFPIAPPRTRRHCPTPQKGIAEMEKLASSLDEGMKV